MKWIIGGLILAVVASVVSGRVPMEWVVYSFALMYVCWGLALGFAFMRAKQPGLLMLGITFIASGILAVVMKHWWPLLAGFAMAWVLRAMGMDPLPPPEISSEQPPAQAQAPAAGEDKKT